MNVKIRNRRFSALLSVLLTGNVMAWLVFATSRAPLDADGWSFLERQRPQASVSSKGMEISFSQVADGLNFALARRPVGVWETGLVKAIELLNLPGYVLAFATFQFLQATPVGTSKFHSDLATIIFCAVSIAQWSAIAFLVSVRRVSRPSPAV